MGHSTLSFEHRIINGIDGDPAVFLFLPTYARAMLFDLGQLDAMSNKELLKVSHAFVSHTHIDHFIGFDRLLRVNIPHFRTLYLYGPEGFINNLSAKLKAYTWNLLEPGQVNFVVKELGNDGTVTCAEISNNSRFEPINRQVDAASQLPVKIEEFTDQSYVTATILDHGTSSLAYRYHAPRRFHVMVERLQQYGWQPGPWIRDLQMAMNQDQHDKLITPVEEVHIKAGDLCPMVLTEHPPFSIAYLTDFIFNRENLQRCLTAMHGAHLMFCEATFADADIKRAVKKKHLTTRQAALLGARLSVDRLELHHISGIYGSDTEQIKTEAMNFFELFKAKTVPEIETLLLAELERVDGELASKEA